MDLSLHNVSVRFGEVDALSGVTLSVKPGERLAVIGASGAGKSTLFRALTRGVPLREGSFTTAGRDLYGLSRRELKEVRRRIGTIYQAYNLVPQLPAGTNAALGTVGGMGSLGTLRTFLTGPDAGLSKKVKAALGEVGLGDKIGVRTTDLSGGQQQRVAVARLLVQRPDLILADEPFAAVDPVTTGRVLNTLLDLNREGATLIVNLHDVEIARRFPRIVALREGAIAFDGPPDQLDRAKLAEVYAGDPREARGDGNSDPHDIRHCREQPIRIVEGTDGVASH